MTILIISCNYHFLFSLLVPCTMVKGYKKSPQTSLSTFCEICCYFHIFCVNILSKHTVSYILLFHLWQNSIRCFIFRKLIIESLCFNYSNLFTYFNKQEIFRILILFWMFESVCKVFFSFHIPFVKLYQMWLIYPLPYTKGELWTVGNMLTGWNTWTLLMMNSLRKWQRIKIFVRKYCVS